MQYLQAFDLGCERLRVVASDARQHEYRLAIEADIAPLRTRSPALPLSSM
jgi:hypothetical protein